MSSMFLLFISFSPKIVAALQNITVDDTNPSIVYLPSTSDWQLDSTLASPLDYGGTHTLSQDPTANATFTFTGVAVYFMSPLWPYTVNTAVSLDSGVPFVIDLTDHSLPNVGGGPESAQSQVVWGASGLQNTKHTLVASMASGGRFIVVDAFIYTISDDAEASSSSLGPPISTTIITNPALPMAAIPGSTETETSETSKSSLGATVSTTITNSMLLSISLAHSIGAATSSSFSGALASRTTTDAISPSVTSAPRTGTPSSNRTPTIVIGSVVGLLALVVIISTMLFCNHRRDRHSNNQALADTHDYPAPFSIMAKHITAVFSGRTRPKLSGSISYDSLTSRSAPQSRMLNMSSTVTQANMLSTITTETPYSMGTGSIQHTPPVMHARELPPAYAEESDERVGSPSSASVYRFRESVLGKPQMSGWGRITRRRSPPAYSPPL